VKPNIPFPLSGNLLLGEDRKTVLEKLKPKFEKSILEHDVGYKNRTIDVLKVAALASLLKNPDFNPQTESELTAAVNALVSVVMNCTRTIRALSTLCDCLESPDFQKALGQVNV